MCCCIVCGGLWWALLFELLLADPGLYSPRRVAIEGVKAFSRRRAVWIRALVVPEGRSHIVHGSSDRAWSQGADSSSRMFEVSDWLGETTEESSFVFWLDGVEEWIPFDVNGFEEGCPPAPRCRPLLVRLSRGGSRAGIFGIHTERKDSISCGSGAIVKDWGSCERNRERSKWVNSLSLSLKSLDSASLTEFLSPGNHWLYSLTLLCISRRAWSRASSSLHAIWASHSSSLSSVKLDFRSQPADVCSVSVLLDVGSQVYSCPWILG